MRARGVCLPLALLLLFLAAGASEPRSLRILHVNDTHAQTLPHPDGTGGYAALSTALKQLSANRDDVLVLDAGDMITGSPVSTLYQGLPIFEMLNTLPRDAAVLGNHEFDHGWDKIAGFRRVARFLILCANIRTPTGELLGDAPMLVIERNGIRVGIVGLTMDALPAMSSRRAHAGLRIEKTEAAARRWVPEMERQCDLVVVLSHCGYGEDRRLAAAVPGIDVIVGGHSHTELDAPEHVDETWIVQAGSRTREVGWLDLTVDVDADRIVTATGGLVAVDPKRFPPDPDTARVVDKYERDVRSAMDAVIGQNDVFVGRHEAARRVGEILRARRGADFGYYSPGGTRADVPAGPIPRRRIYEMLPFDNTVVVVRAPGATLRKLFQLPVPDDSKTYSVATADFYADLAIDAGDLDESQVERSDTNLRLLIIQTIQQQKSFKVPAN